MTSLCSHCFWAKLERPFDCRYPFRTTPHPILKYNKCKNFIESGQPLEKYTKHLEIDTPPTISTGTKKTPYKKRKK